MKYRIVEETKTGYRRYFIQRRILGIWTGACMTEDDICACSYTRLEDAEEEVKTKKKKHSKRVIKIL